LYDTKELSMNWRSRFKRKLTPLRVARAAIYTLSGQFGLSFKWLLGIKALVGFAAEYRRFRSLNRGSPFALDGGDVFPALTDRTAATPIEPIYFLQDTWCAGRIAAVRPARHVDVGSAIRAMALIAQFVPVQFVDIRRIDIDVPNLSFQCGSILQLPFADQSICSLSSLCVIEHIGLGRYGDPLDARGSEKAAAELRRVLAPGGDLYVSVPVDDACRVYFNAHRAFTRDYVLTLFSELRLLEERYIYGRTLTEHYRPMERFGTGLYHFRRQ
jgi:SAM-dependent methyltransferase